MKTIVINTLKIQLFFNHTYGKDRVTVRHALDELLEYHLQYKVKCIDGHYIDNSLQPNFNPRTHAGCDSMLHNILIIKSKFTIFCE